MNCWRFLNVFSPPIHTHRQHLWIVTFFSLNVFAPPVLTHRQHLRIVDIFFFKRIYAASTNTQAVFTNCWRFLNVFSPQYPHIGSIYELWRFSLNVLSPPVHTHRDIIYDFTSIWGNLNRLPCIDVKVFAVAADTAVSYILFHVFKVLLKHYYHKCVT